MYNEFQKYRYLNDEKFRFKDSARDVIKIMFEGAGRVEVDEGMDLSKFNKPQVVTLFKSYNSRSKFYLRLMSSYYLDYYNWCIREGFVDSTNIRNPYDYKITKKIIDDIITADLIADKFFNKEDILYYLDQVIDKSNKFIMYAMFSGVCGVEYSDLLNLRIDDINEKRKTVQLISGKVLNVDDLFIQLAKEADKQIKYYPEGVNEANATASKTRRYEYDDSCYIIKSCRSGINNQPINHKIIMYRTRTIQKQTGNKFINGINLYKNGMINYITEKFGEQGITFKEALLTKTNKYNYKYADEMQKYIEEYGSNMTTRMLRMQVTEYIDLIED